MAYLAVSTLGGIELKLDDRPITASFRTRKEVILLVYLMAESHRSHTREFLAELFWPEKPEGVARVNLRQALAGIRKGIGDRQAADPYLLSTHETIQFNQGTDYYLDEQVFKNHFQTVKDHSHKNLVTCQDCIQELLAANSLYGGDYLSGYHLSDSLELDEWIICRREQYFRLMLSALKSISQFFNHLGDYEASIRFSRQLVNLDPLEEGEHQNLMYLLAVSGHRSAAMEQYYQCAQFLKTQLNIDPSPETVALFKKIRSGQIETASTTDLQQETLPIQLTSFIDRQAEMEEFRRCFQNSVCRLLTMVGPPGIGKTRLALRVAEDQRHDYPDGVWFVPLDLSQSGENLVANLSKAIGFTLEGASSTYANQLINFLQWKKVLFLLDHFDDFVGESGVLVKLLSRARQVRLLLTSRERLNLQSACLFRLGGLPCIPPEPPFEAQEGDAAQLFIQRARRIRSGFNPDETETAHIVHICHLVEGNPLAIELAAARLRDLSSEQIADRLERGIEVLYTTAQDIPERQRSVRASLDYSWERLDFLEKEALSKISIFAGAFTPQEALHKAGVQGATLTTLTNKSLLLKGSGDQFVAPNLIRQYAAEKLAEIYPDFFVTLQKSETQPSLVVPLQTSKINSHNLAAQQLLEDRLSYILKRARRGKSLVAVMVHDINLLDSSSPIQTGEQHEAVLTDIKRQVECTLRQSDSIFSTGTSELTIIIEDLNKHQDALTVAQKIVKDSNSIMVKRHRDVLALINLGISIYPQDGEEPQVLLDKAHLALSHARKYGDCIRFFSDE